MDVNEYKKTIAKSFVSACEKSIGHVQDRFDSKEVYAYVVYPSHGFRDVGVAVGVRGEGQKENANQDLPPDILEMLKEHPDLLKKANEHPTIDPEIDVPSWEYVSFCENDFSPINDEINASYDDLYDVGLSPSEIESMFEDIIVSVIGRMKKDDIFKGDVFEEDILLGIFFPDSSSLEITRRSSKNLNSKSWHRKVESFCDSTEPS